MLRIIENSNLKAKFLFFGFLCFLGSNFFVSETQAIEFNQSIDAKSIEILKEMDAYLSPIDAFSLHVEITDQYPSSTGKIKEIKKNANLTVRRPNRLKVDVKIENPESEKSLYYNGETITLFDQTNNFYAQIETPDTTEKALDFAMDELGFTFPMIDFIFENLYKNLTENVIDSYYLGLSEVNGHKCHQLTFNQDDIDWYLWIDAGEKPLPRKFLIVYVNDPYRTKFSAVITKHKRLENLSEEPFNFQPSEGVERIDFLFEPDEEEPEEPEESEINNEAL